MRREGRREFGVYVPPSGEDSVRHSDQIAIELISKINNIGLEDLPKIRDFNENSVERSNQLGVDNRNKSNNIIRPFEENIRQGWGGNAPALSPVTSPVSNSTPAPASTGIIQRIQDFPEPEDDSCGYYVSWDQYVVLGEKWIDSYAWGRPSVAGGRWMGLGEALIFPKNSVYSKHAYFYDYFLYYGAMKLNPRSGGGFALYGYGGMWGRPVGKIQADPDEFPFFTLWNPNNEGDGDVRSGSIRYKTPYAHLRPTRCAPLVFSPRSPSLLFPGNASPPPPPPRKMCGCDCNTIASIIAEHMAEKQRLLDAIKQHIDSRAIEQLEHINKMLQDMEMNVDLQPVIDELKRVERTLWNGVSGG